MWLAFSNRSCAFLVNYSTIGMEVITTRNVFYVVFLKREEKPFHCCFPSLPFPSTSFHFPPILVIVSYSTYSIVSSACPIIHFIAYSSLPTATASASPISYEYRLYLASILCPLFYPKYFRILNLCLLPPIILLPLSRFCIYYSEHVLTPPGTLYHGIANPHPTYCTLYPVPCTLYPLCTCRIIDYCLFFVLCYCLVSPIRFSYPHPCYRPYLSRTPPIPCSNLYTFVLLTYFWAMDGTGQDRSRSVRGAEEGLRLTTHRLHGHELLILPFPRYLHPGHRHGHEPCRSSSAGRGLGRGDTGGFYKKQRPRFGAWQGGGRDRTAAELSASVS